MAEPIPQHAVDVGAPTNDSRIQHRMSRGALTPMPNAFRRAAHALTTPQQRRLTPDEQLHSVSRLSKVPTLKETTTQVMSIPRVVTYLSRQRNDEVLDRLYTRELGRKQATINRLDRKYYGDTSAGNGAAGAQHTPEDIDMLVDRMYAGGRLREKEKHDALMRKYTSIPLAPVRKFASSAEESTTVSRLYNTDEHDNKQMQELFDKHNPYAVAARKRRVLRDAKELESIVDRLYKGEKQS
eukprot:PhM_4_TR16011/c0_g1_i1/m.471